MVDVDAIRTKVEDALAELSDAAEDAKRRGLEALVSVGEEAGRRLDEIDGAGSEDAGSTQS